MFILSIVVEFDFIGNNYESVFHLIRDIMNNFYYMSELLDSPPWESNLRAKTKLDFLNSLCALPEFN